MKIRTASIILSLAAAALQAAATIVTYPAGEGVPTLDTDFSVSVRQDGGPWQPVAVYPVRVDEVRGVKHHVETCLLYTSPSPRDGATSRMPSSA